MEADLRYATCFVVLSAAAGLGLRLEPGLVIAIEPMLNAGAPDVHTRDDGWTVATDDRRAILVAQQNGLAVVSGPELVKAWVDATRPDASTLIQVRNDIQMLAQFRPNPKMADSAWWFRRPDQRES